MFIFPSKSNKRKRNARFLTKDTPFPFEEAYKTLRTNLQLVSVNRQYHKIVVTSAMPGEGKTTVAINLAISIAETGSRVLLVDTDLRKPSIHKYLQLPSDNSLGLTSLLAGLSTPEESIVHLEDTGIDVLASGPLPPNPAEILASGQMEQLEQALAGQFEYMIFDTPPISLVSDAALVSRFADGVLIVVKQHSTTIESAALLKQNLEFVGAKIIGSVINASDIGKRYYSRSFYRYRRKYS